MFADVDTSKARASAGAHVGFRGRGLLLLAGVSAAAASVLLEPTARAYPAIAVLEVLVVVGFATAGYLLLQDPMQRTNGRLLLTSALLQVITHLHLVDHSPLPMVAWLCGPLSAMPAAVVLLRFPAQTLDPLSRAWAMVHLTWLVVSRQLFTLPTPERRLGWWPTIPMSPSVAAFGSTLGNTVLSASTLFFAFLLLRRIRRSRGVARHELMPVTIAAISASLTVVLHLMSVSDSRDGVRPLILGLEQFGLMTVPAAFVFSAVVMRVARAAVADLLMKVNHSTTPRELQAALAETLSDPELTMLYWAPDESQWVDAAGMVVDPNSFTGRMQVPVDSSDGPLAIIVTDPGISRHKHLLEATVAASRLTLHNIAAIGELRDSRARIVQAGLNERRRLERDLHDGVQQRMLAVKMQLEQVRTAADDALRTRGLAEDAIAEITDTMSELRDLALGLHPAVLTQSGLAAAVESATDRLPLSVLVMIPDRRWPDPVEGAAYFFISEGLNNVLKHAQCDSAEVLLTDGGDFVDIEVMDRGRGGADQTQGSGLVGLTDRIAAVGGTVDIISHDKEGTCLRARIPYASR